MAFLRRNYSRLSGDAPARGKVLAVVLEIIPRFALAGGWTTEVATPMQFVGAGVEGADNRGISQRLLTSSPTGFG
jgi:hypothetical protein